MRRGSRSTLVISIVVALATLLPPAPASASSTRLRELQREIAATRSRLQAAMRTDAEILAALRAVESRLAYHRSLLNRAQLRLRTIDISIQREQRRIDRLNRERRQHAKAISARARALYIMGPVDTAAAITGSSSAQEVMERSAALEYAAMHEQRVIEDLARIRHESVLAERELRTQRASAREVRDEIADRYEVVNGLAQVHREARAQVSRRINGLRAELAAEQREQARIIALIRERASQGSVDTGGSSSRGFAWPIRGRITSSYGPRGGGYHTGIDIDCRTGQPIGASKAGRVIASEWGGGYGQMVVIDHGGGYTTLYAHLSRLYVRRDATVRQGQTVGACGTTGNSTGDHLHFEVRVNGSHRNPLHYLP